MKKIVSILYCISFCFLSPMQAQTPFDSFAPETSRQILDERAIAAEQEAERANRESQMDTIVCAAVIDLENQVLVLVDVCDNTIIGAAPLTEEVKKWLSVDPLVDKNISTSPYMYCNGNPIIFVDPDGRDDYFDQYGNFQYRDDKETDYIMVQLENGAYQNLVEFDYSEDQTDNRNMLSNVATYYMKEAGIDGVCRVKTLSPKEYEKHGEGFASVNPKTLLASIRVFEGRINENANTASNLINTFVHEDVHVGGDNNEIHAIQRQMQHWSWATTTSAFKSGIIGYAINTLNDPQFLLEWTRQVYYVPLPLSQYIWYDQKSNKFVFYFEVFVYPHK